MTGRLTGPGRGLVGGAVIAAAALAAALLVLVPSRFGFGAELLPLRPDPVLTPGVVASSDPAVVCAATSYSQAHRTTGAALKRAVYRAYGIVPAGRDFEIDHRLPLALGGADVALNLWPQQGWTHPSFHDKDRLEARLWRLVCRRRTLPLAEAQRLLLGDWTLAYRQVFGVPVPPR